MELSPQDPYLQFLRSVQENPEIALQGFVFCACSSPERLPALLEGAREELGAQHLQDLNVEDLFSQHPMFSGESGPFTWVLPHDPLQVELFFFHLHFLLGWHLREDRRPSRKPLFHCLVFIPRAAIPALMNQNFSMVRSPYGMHIFEDDLKGVVNLEDLLQVGRMTVMNRPWLDQKRFAFLLSHFSELLTDASPFHLVRRLYALNHLQNPLSAEVRLPFLLQTLTVLLQSSQEDLAFAVGRAFVFVDLPNWRGRAPDGLLLSLVFEMVETHLPPKLRYEVLHHLSPLWDIRTELDQVDDFDFDLKVLEKTCLLYLQDRQQLKESGDDRAKHQKLIHRVKPAPCLMHMLSLTPVKAWPGWFAKWTPLLKLLLEDHLQMLSSEEDPSRSERSLLSVLACQYGLTGDLTLSDRWLQALEQHNLLTDRLQQKFRLVCLYFAKPVPDQVKQVPGWQTVRELDWRWNTHVSKILELLLSGAATRDEMLDMTFFLQRHLEAQASRQLDRAREKYQKTPESWRVIGDYGRMFYGDQDEWILLSILDVLLDDPQAALDHMKTALELQISFTSKHFNYKYNFAQKIQTLNLARHLLFVMDWCANQGVSTDPLSRAWTLQVIEEVAWVDGHQSAVDVFKGGFVHLHHLLAHVRSTLLC